MNPESVLATLELHNPIQAAPEPLWVVRVALLWKHRRMLALVTGISMVISLVIAFTLPKQYKSSASIMPPDSQASSASLLAALVSHTNGFGGLASLAGGLLGERTSTALFIELLHSGSVSNHLIDRFDLQHVYHKRYRIDTAKHLAHCTKITEEKKSGVITIEVEDTDRVRARDLAQGYLDELNDLVRRTTTSAAHRQRVFIEQRLHGVQADLEQAQLDLSEFSSKNSAIDIKEQTRAMVDAGARVQAELLLEQSQLESQRQIYGDGNIRIRETEARITSLKAELAKMTGTSAPPEAEESSSSDGDPTDNKKKDVLYPPLRQLPRLAVPYADLYRRVKIQETLYELLTQQFEIARIEEAKDVPSVSVIDAPGIAEKKSFPPRLLVSMLLTLFCFACASIVVLVREYWSTVATDDPRKMLASEVTSVIPRQIRLFFSSKRGGV